jgi:soluble cytochrome b562
LVSFLLGVAATACWFHFAPIHTAENLPQPIDQQNNPQPTQPVTVANPSAQKFVEQPVPVAPSAVEDVKLALPNYASLSVEQGTEILREAALKKYADAAAELQSQVTRAQEELKEAQNKSPADQQAAMKHLQEVQTDQSQKLAQIGGELQTQIAALKQLKGGQ